MPRTTGRRELILDTFVRHVAERGYDGTNLGDIAAELEISKGTIVHHFTSKDRMLAEAHERYMRRRLAEVRLITTALRTPSERIAGILVASLLYQHHDRSATVAFQREVTRFRDEDVMGTVQPLRDEFMSIVVGVIEQGIAEGTFQPLDPRITAMAMMSFGFWAWTWYEPDEARPPDMIAAQLNALFQGGLVRDRAAVPDATQLDDHVIPLVRRVIESLA